MTDAHLSPGNAEALLKLIEDAWKDGQSQYLWADGGLNWEDKKGVYAEAIAELNTPAQAMPQQVQEACAQVADRAAERYAEGKVMPGDHIRHMLALGIARSIRSLIPPASQLPSTESDTDPDQPSAWSDWVAEQDIPSTSSAGERCPACRLTDAQSKIIEIYCTDPWHADDHLRAKTSALSSPERNIP